MKKLLLVFFSGVLVLGSGQLAAKAEVDITWQNPEKFRDVKPSNESRKRYRERVFAQLDEYLLELAERLPDEHKLLITVNDLDLAGEVWPASFAGLGHSMSDVRVIKSIDIPRMSFQYKLVNQSGEVVQEADVKLKDMSFQNRANHFFNSESLRYEKNMLLEWFEDEFPSLIVKN